MDTLNIENIDWRGLTPAEENPRFNDHAVEDMVQILKDYGFRVPMIVKKDGSIIDGHLRWKAAKAMGLETVPVIYGDDMTEKQIEAFRIAVNRASELASWDFDKLNEQLQKIEGFDFFTGFTFEAPQTFAPTVNPKIDTHEVDQQEVDRATDEQQHRFDGEQQPQTVSVICPHCAEEFEFSGS